MAACPVCQAPVLGRAARLRAAVDAEVHCPACGAAIRLGAVSRFAQIAVGDVALLSGFALSFTLGAPAPLVLAAGAWLSLAAMLPLRGRHETPPH